MITPRRTRLVRVPDLHAFRHAIAGLSLAGDARRVASRVVLVPTRGAALQLRRTIGSAAPALATREEFYGHLHRRLDSPPARLTAYERDVMVRSAAREVSPGEAWRLRPGFLAEMTRFYDQLRRQGRTVARLEELLDEALLNDAEHDRGAERMLAQTHLLTATFRGYERRLQASGACDEHALRELLMARASSTPIREIVVTLGDWIADPAGLYLADFDLLTRLPGLEGVDVLATTTLLESGFHQRIHEWLPGIEECEAADLGLGPVPTTPRPALAVPGADRDQLVFVRRDREEELIEVARQLKDAALPPDALHRVAVVFKRPLPYLYLAREVFGGAGLPYQASDALPLAAEPFAAALDLIFEFVESGFTRASMVALLRSPHFEFRNGNERIDRESVAALDRELSEQRYLGGLERLKDVSDEGASAALHAARTAALMLAPLTAAAPASSQVQYLLRFLDAYQTPIEEGDSSGSRLCRGRAAVRDVLDALAGAYAAHDDAPIDISAMAANVRRWIEEQTFVPDSDGMGVQFVDDQAARYGEFDEIALVGLVDGEWPDRPTRNIFYPSSLLASLGWPAEKDRRGAAEARFLELLRSPHVRVTVSTVSLDDEALVEPSSFIDEIPRAGLPVAPKKGSGVRPLFRPGRTGTVGSRATGMARHAGGQVARGRARISWLDWPVGTGLPSRAWSVSALETYLGCPFKFFAQHVLRLEEEPEDEEVMDPRTQGRFVHEVFEAFFKRWQEEGHQAITPVTIDLARSVFQNVVEKCLERLSDTEAALERTRLLGSPAAAGLGEAVLRMEAERPVPVVARLLEHRLKGDFAFDTAGGPAPPVVERQSGSHRPPRRRHVPADRLQAWLAAEQGTCAAVADLRNLRGAKPGRLSRHGAGPLARRCTSPSKVRSELWGCFRRLRSGRKVLADAQQRLVDTVDAIEAGQFPPTPDDVFRCETCTYAAVCRKDYVGDV